MVDPKVLSILPADPTAWVAETFYGGDEDAAVRAWHAGETEPFEFAAVALRYTKLKVDVLENHVSAIAEDGDGWVVCGSLADWQRIAQNPKVLGTKPGSLGVDAVRGVAPKLFGFPLPGDKRVKVVGSDDDLADSVRTAALCPVVEARVSRRSLTVLKAVPGVRVLELPRSGDEGGATLEEVAAFGDDSPDRVRKAYQSYAAAVTRFVEAVSGQVDPADLSAVLPDTVDVRSLVVASGTVWASLADRGELGIKRMARAAGAALRQR